MVTGYFDSLFVWAIIAFTVRGMIGHGLYVLVLALGKAFGELHDSKGRPEIPNAHKPSCFMTVSLDFCRAFPPFHLPTHRQASLYRLK